MTSLVLSITKCSLESEDGLITEAVPPSLICVSTPSQGGEKKKITMDDELSQTTFTSLLERLARLETEMREIRISLRVHMPNLQRLAQRPSTQSSFNGWVKALELDASISGGKTPVDDYPSLVALALPGSHLSLEHLHGGEPIGEALPR